jgi:hypothetical protein
MSLDVVARRRWIGALSLLAALAMLVCGQGVLKGRLGGMGFVVYWLLCFGFTGLAILMAFLDVRALGNRSRQEQRDLLISTLKNLETDAKLTPSQSPSKKSQEKR